MKRNYLTVCAAALWVSSALGTVAHGAEAGESYVVTKIRYQPREGHAERMKGGRFSGSLTGPTNDFETLVQVTEAPTADG